MVTRADLLAARLSSHQIRQRLRRGTLIAIHRGVYRVGHAAPSREATYLAAVLACGPGALLAGPAAAHLWRLIKGRPPRPEVLAPTDRRVPGVIVHRARHEVAEARHEAAEASRSHRDPSGPPPLAAGAGAPRGSERRLPDAAVCLGIPVTSVPRTLVDLAATLPAPALARACHEAGVLHRTTPRQVEAILARRPNATGARALRRILHGDEPVTLSPLERRFLARLREAGLPLPETNRSASGRRVDCRWPDRHLTVELDSYRFHNSRHAWEGDRQREREARARGDEFRRYTWRDVDENPGAMLRELGRLLASRRPRPAAQGIG